MDAQKTTRIDPSEIPDAEFDTACRVLDDSVRLLFRQPGIEKEYNEFLKKYEEERRMRKCRLSTVS